MRRKKLQKKESEIDFKKELEGKKFPILTLDEKWHNLFPDGLRNGHIQGLEKEINNLLKEQGKVNNKLKELEKLKKTLMDKILINMNEAQHDDFTAQKQDKSQKIILDINEKKKKAEIRLEEIPDQLKEVNQELLIESMNICYKKLEENKQEIHILELWINETRELLKEKILMKQAREIQNTEMYAYLHDMLGKEVMEVFDIRERLEAEDQVEEGKKTE